MKIHAFPSQEIGVKCDSNLIQIPERTIGLLQNKIFNGDIVIIENFLSQGEAYMVRESAHRFFCDVQPENPAVAIGVTRNYWRFNNNPEKSSVKGISRQFTGFFWNEDSIPGFLQVMDRLARFRNVFSGFGEDFALDLEEKGHISVPSIIHYPRGGGYLQKHRDPDSIQKAVFMVKMSQMGVDYKDGGLCVESDLSDERITIDQHLGPGDLYIIKPSCQHAVLPIDPEVTLDLRNNSGRWMMMSTLVLANSL